MANIIYWLETNTTVVTETDATKFDVHGKVLGDEGSGEAHSFEALGIAINADAATINAVVLAAAIAQYEADEAPAIVGPGDRKTFIGGGVFS